LIYGVGYIISFLVGRLMAPEPWPTFIYIIAFVSIGFALLTSILVRHRTFSPTTIQNLAVPFCIAGGLGIVGGEWGWETRDLELFRQMASIPEPYVKTIIGGPNVGWVNVWIIVFPLLVPLPFWRMVLAAVATGSLNLLVPLGSVAVNGLPEEISPYLGHIVITSAIPTVICICVSILASRIVYGMARDITRARRLGSYQLMKTLGKGGMGEVWIARHRMMVRPAAIKLIRPEMLSREGGTSQSDVEMLLKRFEREVQTTAGLTSPNTVRVYDFGLTDDGTFYYVMELLQGMDLRRLVDRFGPIPPERVVYILRQACHSLAEAHASGLIHRDIKPANIFICHRGLDYDFVKVLDFGLVKDVSEGSREGTLVTAQGIVSGTPAYMSPEMAQGDSLDGRTDIYALGCVAWWLLTGRQVFEGESAVKLLVQHASEKPERPSACSELDIPPELDDLILACLEKHPDKRPASAEDLAFRLEAMSKSMSSWTSREAKSWWELHLPEISGAPRELSESIAAAGGAENSIRRQDS
jgi:serine/threonine-protein kinase